MVPRSARRALGERPYGVWHSRHPRIPAKSLARQAFPCFRREPGAAGMPMFPPGVWRGRHARIPIGGLVGQAFSYDVPWGYS